jgi:biotin carboxyl carrier protein
LIAVLLPLTGRFASIGIELRTAIQLAPATGTTWMFLDTRGDPDAARAAVEAAVGREILELWASGNDVTVRGERKPVRVETREAGNRAKSSGKGSLSGTVRAPMPGRVVKVLVEPGVTVAKGTGVVVVEAMKMENELSSSVPGVVERVFVSAGDAVERGAPLVEIR